jgi:predicted AlkP superfamily phosphohydrolase/phosphomutase
MDALVGRTMKECDDPDTVLMVVSDHGFNPFRRGVDWNAWLERNGYLTLQPEGRGRKYLAGVDWSQTRAYCLGLAGIWLNVKGREAQGIVDPEDADALCAELCGKLTELRDESTGEAPVRRGLAAKQAYSGPYKGEAPDIIIGYNRGYRVSWEAAIGEPTDAVFRDNTKPWSGDHCIDPALIPGVLFCNRKISDEHPRLIDLGPTTLDLFGVDVPGHMDGRPLDVADSGGRSPASRRWDQGDSGRSKSVRQPTAASTA